MSKPEEMFVIEARRPVGNTEHVIRSDNRLGRDHLDIMEVALPTLRSHGSAQNWISDGSNEQFSHEFESFSIRSEHTDLPRRDLGIFDVAALILNKQIGTGIFTTPGIVLSLTGSKALCLGLWIAGGIWALVSVTIFVEFGSAFPFNGGELIYLDEAFRSPELLATILFSFLFVFAPHTDGNSIQFAKHVLLSANPEITSTAQLDKALISFIAITVLTATSLIHYFSRSSGLFLNLLLAVYKVVLLTVIITFGLISIMNPENRILDWGHHSTESINTPAAMVFVIYSYQGWQNANYVAGELKLKNGALKWGAALAVIVLTFLYAMVVTTYSLVCSYHEIAGHELGFNTCFIPRVFGESSSKAFSILVAISAFGNLIAVVYTFSKVKQQIARQCIMPFYRFFAVDDKQFMTPTGALVLQWVVGVIWILVTPNSTEGYMFVIGLWVYEQLLVGVFVGIAFLWIRRIYEAENTRNATFSGGSAAWQPVTLKNKYMRMACVFFYVTTNIWIMVQISRFGIYVTNKPLSNSSLISRSLSTFVFSFLATGLWYWAVIRIIEKRSSADSPLEIRVVKDGMAIDNEADLARLQRAKLEGNNRVIIYRAHGRLKRVLDCLDLAIYKTIKLISR